MTYLEGRYMGYRWYDGNRSGGCALRPNGENPCVAFPWPWSELTTFSLTPFAQRWENGVLKLETTVTNRGGGGCRGGAGLSRPRNRGSRRSVSLRSSALPWPREKRGRSRYPLDPQASHHPFDVFDDVTKAFRPASGPIKVYLGTSSSLRICGLSRFWHGKSKGFEGSAKYRFEGPFRLRLKALNSGRQDCF